MKVRVYYRRHLFGIRYFQDIEDCPSVELAKLAFQASNSNLIVVSAKRLVESAGLKRIKRKNKKHASNH